MQADDEKASSDYDRLKEINDELSTIANERKSCRSKTSILGAIAGVLVAVSLITFFQSILNMDTDWHANVNSPVHDVAEQDKSSKIVLGASVFGFVLGLGLFALARKQCSESNLLNNQERILVQEMRVLRDKMYIKTQRSQTSRTRTTSEEPNLPLTPDEARGEYVGVYSPPGSKN